MRFAVLICMLVGLVAECAAQATPAPTPTILCPGGDMLASSARVVDGDTVTFQYDVTGGNIDRSLIKYYWYVSRGRIVGGQGTPVIVVDTSGQSAAGSITAQIGLGMPHSDYCETIGPSETVRVLRKGLTKADVFWDWYYDNCGPYYTYYLSKRTDHDAIFDDLTAHLRQVDPDLTYQMVPDEKDRNQFQLVIGYSGKEDKSKIVADLVSRAPLSVHCKAAAVKP